MCNNEKVFLFFFIFLLLALSFIGCTKTEVKKENANEEKEVKKEKINDSLNNIISYSTINKPNKSNQERSKENLRLLLKNSGFEDAIPDQGDNGKTFDPAIWIVAKGKTEKGTANVIEEWPGLIQVVSKENEVLPYEGDRMLKIDARLYIKTNSRQYYTQPIREGKFVQEIALHPFSNEYLQQIEIRGTTDKNRQYKEGTTDIGIRGNQLFSLKYSHLGMLLVVATGEETKNGKHIIWKEYPALPKKQWSKIKIFLEKAGPGRDEIGEFSQFKLSLYVNDKLLYQSGEANKPYIQFFSSADFLSLAMTMFCQKIKSQKKIKFEQQQEIVLALFIMI